MTIEEKAKAYDKALNWMRELYPGLHGATKEDAEHYFPELAESEDERIRKCLADCVSWFGEDSDFFAKHNLTKVQVLAWLEKQKESNIDKLRRISTPASENWLEVQKQWEEEDKQAEQQPAEWSEEDKQWLSEVYFAIDHSMYSEVERQAMKEYIDFLRSQSKSKQEWSEEDEKIEKAIESVIRIYGKTQGEFIAGYDMDTLIVHLRTAFNRVHSWNSKDKDVVVEILRGLRKGILYEEAQEIADEMLKSLRPQPHWKPSKEEMEALDVACSGKLWYGEIYLEGLKRIREQLKKL